MSRKIKIFLSVWKEDYLFSTVPASAIAAYTTRRVTVSILHYKRSRRLENFEWA